MTSEVLITRHDMPAPQAMIDYGNGEVGAAMFFYAAEGHSYREIARDAGFDSKALLMFDDPGADEKLGDDYSNDDPTVLSRWNPVAPDGWRLAAKHDTEDGPCAMFIRPLKAAQS